MITPEDTTSNPSASNSNAESPDMQSPAQTKPFLSRQRMPLDRKKLTDAFLSVPEMNTRYAVVKFGSKVLVADQQRDEISFMSFADFKNLYSNILVQIGDRSIPLGQYWLKHPGRRQYSDGVVFDPSSKTSNDQFNLWKGFAVNPDSNQSCERFLQHLESVICNGNQEHFEYFLGWLALLVQRPWELPGVAIVLLSPQGTGKGLLMDYLGKIFGRHYKYLTGKSHLVGQYTGHLHDAVLVFADELAWGNSREEAGTLKSMITEPSRMMEKKFADAVPVKNCTHLIVASNEDHVVPAEISDRRYFILQVADTQKGNQTYFSKLVAEMDSGGPSALLGALMSHDISGFQPTRFPKTSARVNQQLLSLGPVETWLEELLQNGYIQHGTQANQGWPDKIEKHVISDLYWAWHTKRQIKHSVPSLKVLTSTLKKYGITTYRMPADSNGKRAQGYKLPSLNIARKIFADSLGGEITWE